MAFLPEARLFLTFSQKVPLTHNPPRVQSDPSRWRCACSQPLSRPPVGPRLPPPGLWSCGFLHQGCPRLSWGPAFCACCLLCELSLLWPARLSSGCACEDGRACTDPRAGRPRRKASLYRSSPAILAGLPHLLFFSASSVKWRWDLPFNTIILK